MAQLPAQAEASYHLRLFAKPSSVRFALQRSFGHCRGSSNGYGEPYGAARGRAMACMSHRSRGAPSPRPPARGPASFYDTLEVTQSASFDEVKASYRRLAKHWHPDIQPQDVQVTHHSDNRGIRH
jgi:hypothetical protein